MKNLYRNLGILSCLILNSCTVFKGVESYRNAGKGEHEAVVENLIKNLEKYTADCPEDIMKKFNRFSEAEPGLKRKVLCGSVKVPEWHGEAGHQVSLSYAYISPVGGPADIPVVYAAGGPGSSYRTLFLYPEEWKLFLPVADEFGLFVYEYRGSDYSAPVPRDCGPFRYDLSDLDGWADSTRKCMASLTDEVDYDYRSANTLQRSHDLAHIVNTLGFTGFKYYGFSYSTLLAQYIAILYPDLVKGMYLEGLFPHGYSPDDSLYVEQRLKHLDDLCHKNKSCSERYGTSLSDYHQLFDRYNSHPVVFDNGSVFDGMNVFMLAGLPFNEEEHAKPLILFERLRNLLEKDPAVLKNELEAGGFAEASLSVDPPYWLALCPEILLSSDTFSHFRSPDRAKRKFAHTSKVCRQWVQPETLKKLTVSDKAGEIPMLLTTGSLDISSPFSFAEAVKKRFPRSRSYLLQGYEHRIRSHDNSCVSEAMLKFFRNPREENTVTCSNPVDFTGPAGEE